MDIQMRRQQILMEMTQINTMEKGRLTEEYRESYKDGKPVKLGPYYKYQRWEDGKNVSQRIPAHQAEDLRLAVEGYHRFKALADEYAELTVEMTRNHSDSQCKKKPRSF
jgi:hypothetical protein